MAEQIKELIDFGIARKSEVLVIYPHPDDETVFSAGLIQKIVAQNIHITLVCLTKGEVSTLRYGLDQKDDLPKVRAKEFVSVCKLLGVKDYKILDFKDGKCTEQSEEIYAYLRRLLPEYDVVLTYEPNGVYGHPDHMFLSEAITDLQRELKFKLIYVTIAKWYRFLKVKPMPPTHFLKLNIKEHVKKIKCIRIYKTQFSFIQNPLRYLMLIIYTKKEYLFFII